MIRSVLIALTLAAILVLAHVAMSRAEAPQTPAPAQVADPAASVPARIVAVVGEGWG